MEIKRKLRKVGNSVMVPIPPEALQESGFREGDVVQLRARLGHIDLDSDHGPDAEVAAFAARFTERYREALRRLADL
jgi:antitoxin component of MazEF toxin-antitoxin module